MTKGIFIPIDGNEEQVKAITTVLKDSGVEFSEVGPSKSKIKKLPRLPNGMISNVFIANGTTYTILSPDEGIGIERYTQLTKFLIPFWYGKRSFEEVQRYWMDSITEVCRTANHSEAITLHINKAKLFVDSLTDISKERYDLSMYICAIFIIRQGEDQRRFSIAEAEQKIEDWIEEGYSPTDFFGIASGLSTKFREEYEAKLIQQEEQKELMIKLGNTKSTDRQGS